MTRTPRPHAIGSPILADDSRTSAGSFPEKKKSGPKTVTGKRRAALNSLRHGIYADAILIKGEDREDYLRFARSVVAGLDVQTALEMACAERVISALWRSRRARRYEQAYLSKEADEVERMREVWDNAQAALADHEREFDAMQKLARAERMTEDELSDAASALFDVYEANPNRRGDDELQDSFWGLFPERGHVSRKCVAQIADQVRAMFEPSLTPEIARGNASEFWSWAASRHYSKRRDLNIGAIRAGEAFLEARRRTYILPLEAATYRFDDLRIQRSAPGSVLEDAERRLDRQVSRALVDLEAARRLRP